MSHHEIEHAVENLIDAIDNFDRDYPEDRDESDCIFNQRLAIAMKCLKKTLVKESKGRTKAILLRNTQFYHTNGQYHSDNSQLVLSPELYQWFSTQVLNPLTSLAQLFSSSILDKFQENTHTYTGVWHKDFRLNMALALQMAQHDGQTLPDNIRIDEIPSLVLWEIGQDATGECIIYP